MKKTVCYLSLILAILLALTFSFASCKKNKGDNNDQQNGGNVGDVDNNGPTDSPDNGNTDEHSCNYGEWQVTVEPTCEAIGKKVRSCSCGKSEEEILPKTGHTISSAEAKAKTCTEDGWNAYEYCTECDYTTKVVIPAGHSITNAEAKAKTCTEDGWNAYEYCTECDYTTKVVIPAGHTLSNVEAKANTCTEDGWNAYEYCTECDYTTKEVIYAPGHNLNSVEAKEPTCSSVGWNDYEYCSSCSYTTYSEIAQKEHTPVKDEGYEATQYKTGLSDGSHCSVCGEVIEEQKCLYYFTIEIYNEQFGAITSFSHSHASGETIDLGAYTYDGRGFAGWYSGKALVSSLKSFAYTMPSHNVSLMACFTAYPNMDVWFGDTATSFESGTGTEEDPFIIVSGAQLKYLSDVVNSRLKYGREYYQDLYYRLEKSIDMGLGGEWTPIGNKVVVNNNNASFEGFFDGNDCVIYGMILPKNPTTRFVGLFGYAVTSTIKNLRIECAVANVTYNVEGENFHFGTLLAYGAGESIIDNVQVISTPIHVVANVGESNAINVGGIGGYINFNNKITVNDIVYTGSISVITNADSYVAGLIGDCFGLGIALNNCEVNADITYSGTEVVIGGLLGEFSQLTMTNCHYQGNINVTKSTLVNAGGLIGGSGSAYSHYLNMEACTYKGSIDINSTGNVYAYGASYEDVDTASGCIVEARIDISTSEDAKVKTDVFAPTVEVAEGCATAVVITVNGVTQ